MGILVQLHPIMAVVSRRWQNRVSSRCRSPRRNNKPTTLCKSNVLGITQQPRMFNQRPISRPPWHNHRAAVGYHARRCPLRWLAHEPPHLHKRFLVHSCKCITHSEHIYKQTYRPHSFKNLLHFGPRKWTCTYRLWHYTHMENERIANPKSLELESYIRMKKGPYEHWRITVITVRSTMFNWVGVNLNKVVGIRTEIGGQKRG